MENFKVCGYCKELKNVNEFYQLYKCNTQDRHYYCITCESKRKKNYHGKNVKYRKLDTTKQKYLDNQRIKLTIQKLKVERA